jgi:hypothetical protein
MLLASYYNYDLILSYQFALKCSETSVIGGAIVAKSDCGLVVFL